MDKFVGIRSGKRSCIIKIKDGEFLKLKGKGNYKSGFTLLEYENDFPFEKNWNKRMPIWKQCF